MQYVESLDRQVKEHVVAGDSGIEDSRTLGGCATGGHDINDFNDVGQAFVPSGTSVKLSCKDEHVQSPAALGKEPEPRGFPSLQTFMHSARSLSQPTNLGIGPGGMLAFGLTPTTEPYADGATLSTTHHDGASDGVGSTLLVEGKQKATTTLKLRIQQSSTEDSRLQILFKT